VLKIRRSDVLIARHDRGHDHGHDDGDDGGANWLLKRCLL